MCAASDALETDRESDAIALARLLISLASVSDCVESVAANAEDCSGTMAVNVKMRLLVSAESAAFNATSAASSAATDASLHDATDATATMRVLISVAREVFNAASTAARVVAVPLRTLVR